MSLDIRKAREQLFSYKGAQKTKYDTSIRTATLISNKLKSYTEEQLDMLESLGFSVRELKAYDLEKVATNEEANTEFKKKYQEIAEAMMKLLEENSVDWV